MSLALTDLFEPQSPLGQKLAAGQPYASDGELIARARAILPDLTDDEKVATLNAHPRIGEDPARLTTRSLDEQGAEALPELRRLNDEYERRFGFRFVTFVNRRPQSAIVPELRARLGNGRDHELDAGLRAIVDIAEDRLRRAEMPSAPGMDIRYGKHEVSFYRTHPTRLLFAGVARVDVFGNNFRPAYTEGDNRNVVATDTMKNFVYAMALEFPGERYETFAHFLGKKFLEHYPQMESLRIRLRELPFTAHSDKLLSPLDGDYETVDLGVDRNGVHSLRCGRERLRLVKLTGSAFRSFARDEFTTLPERTDRPLYIYLDVHWRYADAPRALAEDRLYGSGKIRDTLIETFDDFVSMSIQHLVHEMGRRALARFPDLQEISFSAQNRLWDTSAAGSGDAPARVFSNPKPAHGVIGLTLRR